MPPSTLSPSRIARLLLIPAVAWLLLVWPALHGPFVFDDFPNLGSLSRVPAVDSWRELGLYLSDTAQSFPGRPLAMLSFLPQQGDWPGNPFPFKLVNLALHLLNAGLLFALLARIAGTFLDAGRARIVAVAAAVAWLVLPIQLSTVLLVVQRMTLLSTLFSLLGLLAYCHGLLSTQSGLRTRGAWMALGLVGGTALAVLCKENGALLPVFAWVLGATVLRPARDALPPGLRRWNALLIYPAVALVAAFLLWQLPDAGSQINTRDFTLLERLLTQPRVLLDYLGKALFPRYASFGVFHDDFAASRGLLDPATTLPALLAVLGAIAAAIAWRKRAPLAAFAVLWFFGGHLIESGPLNLELYFEHRNYLPLAGPVFAAVAGLARMQAGPARRLSLLLMSVWALASLGAVALSAQVWSSQVRMASFWAAAHPASVRAQTMYAESLFTQGHPAKARQVIEQLAHRRPDDAAPILNLLFIDCSQNQLDKAAVDAARSRLASSRWSRGTYQALGELRVLVGANRCPAALDAAAWLSLSDALLANPAFAGRTTAGNLHYQRHELAKARGELDKVLEELDRVDALDPNPDIVRLQARYLAEAGLHEAAIERLRSYDPVRRPLLRRLLVDDAAINAEMAEAIGEAGARAAAAGAPPQTSGN